MLLSLWSSDNAKSGKQTFQRKRERDKMQGVDLLIRDKFNGTKVALIRYLLKVPYLGERLGKIAAACKL